MHDNCLRFQSALEMPADKENGCAVYPNAIKNGQCRFYRKDEKVTLATGFVVKNNPRATNMFVEMRHRITNYLGGNGTYYLYPSNYNGYGWKSDRQKKNTTFLRALITTAL